MSTRPLGARAPMALFLGGARSGKSTLAEACALPLGRVLYVATAHPPQGDAEMEDRIRLHRERRPPHWETLETPKEPLEISQQAKARNAQAVLFDCATLWLAWEVVAQFQKYSRAQLLRHLEHQMDGLFQGFRALDVPLLVVSNETGQGVVPAHDAGRFFRDAQGILNCRLAAEAEVVVEVRAGLPLLLKAPALGAEGGMGMPVLRVEVSKITEFLKAGG